MFYKQDLQDIKLDIKNKIGEKIVVKGSLGRCKTFEKPAVIENAYQDIFVVKYDENNRNASYQYKDVLTKIVDIEFLNPKTLG